MQDFKNLKVWQKSHALTLSVYHLTENHPRFGLSEQLQRSALSIESNIAEGSARGSDAEFRRFLFIALGSGCELECQLLVARDLGRLTPPQFASVNGLCEEVRRMLWSLIRRLEA